MKSFSWVVKESDARDLTIIEPKLRQVDPPWMKRRSNCASPKVRGCFSPRPSLSAAGMTELLIVPTAQGPPPQAVPASRSWDGPHTVPVHERAEMSARLPP